MSADPVACPYCNAHVAVAPGAANGQRIPCPRCGEGFTLMRPDAPGATDLRTEAAARRAAAPQLPFDLSRRSFSGRGKRLTVMILLGVMGFMAATSLAFALYTQAERRKNDKGITQSRPKRRPAPNINDAAGPTPVAPAKLEALRWLPRDTNLIAGVHVAELARGPAGKEILTTPLQVGPFKVGAAEVPRFEVRLETLIAWTGLKADDIDHLVLAIKADDSFPPRVNLIVRTREPYDAGEFVKKLKKAEHVPGVAKKAVYQFQPSEAPFKPVLWCADDRTVVYGLLPSHLDAVPTAPQTDLQQLPHELQTVIKERVDAVGPLWVAGSSDDWGKTAVPMLLGQPEPGELEKLTKVRTFAAWVQFDDPVKVNAVFDCRTDAAAQTLWDYLAGAEGKANPDLIHAIENGWLTLQLRTQLDKVRAALER